jgi:predicted esterase
MREPAASDNWGFIHLFIPPAPASAAPALLLLHGTGGDETDLIPIGQSVAPGAALLSPRGKILERGMPRFFRRLAEGVFDLEDLKYRTHELAEFVENARRGYGIQDVVAVGFSNGANIAASLLLLEPGILRGAALLHAMGPIVPDPLPDLTRVKALITAGRTDPIVSPEESERLADLLRSAGAEVEFHWESGGHTICAAELAAVRDFVDTFAARSPHGQQSHNQDG